MVDGLPRADLDRAVALPADRFSRLLAACLQVRAQGGAVVLVTDRWLAPIAGTADAVLSCEVDAPSAYDSLVPAMAVVETVVAGCWPPAATRPRPHGRVRAGGPRRGPAGLSPRP